MEATVANETVNAIAAKATFESLMRLLRTKPLESSVADYEALKHQEDIEMQLEVLEPVLSDITKGYGFRYESPGLSEEGEELLMNSLTGFIKRYAWDLKESMRGPMPGFVYI